MKKGDSKFKKFLNRFWFLVWKDNSLQGWILSIIFLFLVIKLIFFPLLNLATGTALPLVIVESCSMYHEGNLNSDFDSWWDDNERKYIDNEIKKQEFQEFPFKSGFNKGDILFVVGANPEKLKEGDVIIFEANQKYPVIHRIVDIDKNRNNFVFSTLGDNNDAQLAEEKEISPDKIVGKAIAKPAPYLGWIKLIFFEQLKPKSQRGFC